MIKSTVLLLFTTRGAIALSSPHARRSIPPSPTRLRASSLSFDPKIDHDRTTSTLLIGRRSALSSLISKSDAYVSLFGFRPAPSIMEMMLRSVGAGGSTASHVLVPTVGPEPPRPPHCMGICCVKDGVSRNNHPLSLHAVTDMVRELCGKGTMKKGVVHIVCCVEGEFALAPVAAALARAFPTFTKKTKGGDVDNDDDHGDEGDLDRDESEGWGSQNGSERVIRVTFLDQEGRIIKNEMEISAARATAEGVRLACRLVDTHPEELTTTTFAKECRDLFKNEPAVTIEEIQGSELQVKGYGGIYNVGKAATHPPRLLILTYDPVTNGLIGDEGEKDSIALVGKGIVYDTGGLAIKSKTGMCGMKSDMGGAAGVLGGFMAAVQLKTPRKLRLLLCLAENAIGPTSLRNDDIITQYSGKTVEINNSDAEGRLVLADAVSHVTKHYNEVGLVVDMATLTGAQLTTTGKVHAGILANTLEMEQKAIKAGLLSGDLCFPLLYAPELLKKEFASKVADMKNSVKDRSNAQSSCAGHFIESHIDSSYKGGWIHVDMAGPAWKADRGTGYGVGLVLALVGAPGFCDRVS